MSLVNTDWLEENLNRVKILDASWHMPNSNRDAYKEFLSEHIENSQFFDFFFGLIKSFYNSIVVVITESTFIVRTFIDF